MNFVERYVAYARELTEAPPLFHYYMAYMLLSFSAGKKCVCNYSDYNAGPNMWMVFIGTSSIARKSSAWKIGTDLLDDLYLTDTQGWQMPSDGSYESWIEFLHNRKNEAGVAQGMMVFDEFKRLHDWVSQKYASQLESLLLSTYDQTRILRRVGTRKDVVEYFIPHPYLNIAAASTISLFNQSVTPQRINSGFLPRFQIITCSDMGKLIPRRAVPLLDKKRELVDELARVRNSAGGEYLYEPAAGALYDKWYTDIARDKLPRASEHMAPFLSRRRSDVHKYAMLNCIMRNEGRTMTVEDVTRAIDEAVKTIVSSTEEVINKQLAFTPFQENRVRVCDLIYKYGGENGGAPHSKILKLSKLDKWNFDKIIETLADEQTILVNKEGSGDRGGRPSTHYKIKVPEE
jgi:hypothetical protein